MHQKKLPTIFNENKLFNIYFLVREGSADPVFFFWVETNSEKKTVKGNVHKTAKTENDVQHEITFELPADFGNVGALQVENEHHKEVFLNSIVLDGFPDGPVQFTCDSWIQPKHDSPAKRVFFTNKVRIFRKWHFKQFLVLWKTSKFGEHKFSRK